MEWNIAQTPMVTHSQFRQQRKSSILSTDFITDNSSFASCIDWSEFVYVLY